MIEWKKISTAPLDGTPVILFTKTYGICEAWFDEGYWSESTPVSPAEYSGSAWICCDDQFQIEVEEWCEDSALWNHGEVTHWAEKETPQSD